MNPSAPAAANRAALPWGDALLTLLLAAGLLAMAGRDLGAYHRQQRRGAALPDFDLLQTRGRRFVGRTQFLPVQAAAAVRVENIDEVETSGRRIFRHGLGPVSTVEIYTEHPRAHLDLEYENAIPGQDLTVRCNEQVLEQFTALPPGVIQRRYALELRPGANRFTVTYARYNHAGADDASPDPRPIAGDYLALNLFLD